MDKTVVLGVLLSHRKDQASKFQEIVTGNGCKIKTRVGLHHADVNNCPISGVILLDIIGTDEEIKALEDDIKTLSGVQVQKMEFVH